MTNAEKADEICKKHIFDSNHFDCCMEMAQWKEQQIIDKACDTIKHLLGGYVIRNFNFGDSYDMDELIDDLKKAMEE